MSEDALAEFAALATSDRRAVERQLSADERRLVRQALARAHPLSEPAERRVDLSAYSASLAKHLLKVTAAREDAPALTAATRAILLRLLSGEGV